MRQRWRRGLVVFVGASSLLLACSESYAFSPGVSPRASAVEARAANPIVRENRKPGTGVTSWTFSSAPGRSIEGYTSQPSIAPGDVVQLHVSTTPAATYQVRIFRLGFYRGLGARFITCVPGCRRVLRGEPRPANGPDASTGMVREQWPVTATYRIPRTWVSGYYVFQLVLTSGPYTKKVSNVLTIVRARAGAPPTRVLAIFGTNTAQAYNNWGGKSLYPFNSTNGIPANHVSFDRPGGATVPILWDVPMLKILERNGFDVSYATDVDVQRNPASLLGHRLVIVLGHSEYWSKQERDAYEAARDHGVNLAFLGGNIGDWQIRYEDNERTVVGYKTAFDPFSDPSQWTTNFIKLFPPRPQCQLLGTQFRAVSGGPVSQYAINSSAVSDPWFAGTGFKAGDTFAGNNFEFDVAAPNCVGYPLTTFWSDAARPGVAAATRYVAASGATVFSAGSFALSAAAWTDKRVYRFAVNALTALSRSR